ncbi:MAG: hypothetical protein KF886_16825 [Candidatus Hydrogenedentes bacterium]|nr:hypothetical protein [Candidatus Hydrogenedentota bacterium]
MPCAAAVGSVSFDPEAPPARHISEYNLFKDPARQIPNDGVLPYDLNTPLFSDYASKHRFVWMPPGTAARYDRRGPFEFPVGAVLVKTFSYPHDLRAPEKGERLIETRLLVHKPEGWLGFSYIWNEDATDARLAVAGGRVDVSWIHYDGGQRELKGYIIPNMNECKQCHELGGRLQPIGPQARHLNKDYDYGDAIMNQLARWTDAGYLEGAPAPDEAPRVPDADNPASGSLAERARAYLDINCAHCHNPRGPAHMSGLDLSYRQDDPARFGVFKPPIAAGRGSGGHRFGIEPGSPDTSILIHRIESTEPGVMMPPLPLRTNHDEGIALLRQWVLEMQAEVGADNRVTLGE